MNKIHIAGGVTGVFVALLFYKLITLFTGWDNPLHFSNTFDSLLFVSYVIFSFFAGSKAAQE